MSQDVQKISSKIWNRSPITSHNYHPKIFDAGCPKMIAKMQMKLLMTLIIKKIVSADIQGVQNKTT